MDILQLDNVDLSRLPEDFCSSALRRGNGVFHYVGNSEQYTIRVRDKDVMDISVQSAPLRKQIVTELLSFINPT